MNVYDRVKIARNLRRPSLLFYINYIFDNFIELHGDRSFRDDRAIVGGVASFYDIPITVVGIQKGADIEENILRNFGQPHPEGYRKALRLMKQAEKFNRPIILFINTSGAFCGIEAEERGQGEAIARNLRDMFGIRVPIISIITGEGGSGGALALAVADKVWMLENSIYSVLSPEGFATILWRDSSKVSEAANLMKLTSEDLLELGIIEKIIKEVEGGAHLDPKYTAELLKIELKNELGSLLKIDKDILLNERYNRFRKFGDYFE